MNKITENLWLGDYEDVKRLPRNSRKFDLIISLYRDSKYPKFKQIPVIFIDIEDSEEVNILRYFSFTNDLIAGCEHRKERVLVHCRAGISRSASIVLAYLMYRFQITLDDAFKYVSSIRPIIDPNSGFIRQLRHYQRMLLNTNPLNNR